MESMVDKINKAASLIIEISYNSSTYSKLTIDEEIFEIKKNEDFKEIFHKVNFNELEKIKIVSFDYNIFSYFFNENTKFNFSSLKTLELVQENSYFNSYFGLDIPGLESLITSCIYYEINYFENLSETVNRPLKILKLISYIPHVQINANINERKFNGLINLTELDLSYNKIKFISENSFNCLSKLKKLNLSFNELIVIEKNVFNGLTSLEKLVLTGNNGLKLNQSTFDTEITNSLKNLKTLDINYIKYEYKSNNFGHKDILDREIDDDTFFHLSSLENLNFSQAGITHIKENSFNSLSNLKVLNLSGNPLRNINENAFEKLQSLEELNLQTNKFPGSFSCLNFLKKIFEKKNFKLKLLYTLFDIPKEIEMNYCNELDNCYENITDGNILKFYGKDLVNKQFGTKYTIHPDYFESFELKFMGYKRLQKGFIWKNESESPKRNINAIIGLNGVGKTSLLEIIDKTIEDDHKFFISKYFSSAHQKLQVNREEYNKLNDNLFEKAKILKNKQEFIDYVYESINNFSLLQYFDYLLLIGFTYKDFKEHIDKNLFEYEFNEDHIDYRIAEQKLFLRKYKDNNIENIETTYYARNKAKEILPIEYYLEVNKEHNLSPGEYLILLIQLWQMHAKQKNTNMKKKLRILLLDEPDAYMHPKLIKNFVDLIQGDDLDQLKLHIIMTTHNPVTVNFLDKKNIYELKFNKETKEAFISPIKHKSSLIHNLSNNLFYIKEKFKIIFIEGQNGIDIQFYEFIFKSYKKIANIDRQLPIKFQSMGGRMFRQLFEKNTTIMNEDHKLDEFLFGINDGDYNIEKAYKHFGTENKNGLLFEKNFFLLERYHIENYIYDPINFYFASNYLLTKNGKSLKEKENKGYFNQVVYFLNQIKDSKTIYDFIAKDENKLEILNNILKETNNYCINEMNDNKEDEKIKLFLKEFNLSSLEDEKLKIEIPVDFKLPNNKSIQLKYYPILLYFPRRELSRYFSNITNEIYNLVFNIKTPYEFTQFLDETNKLFQIEGVHFNPIAYYFALKLYYSNYSKYLVERDEMNSQIQKIHKNDELILNKDGIFEYLNKEVNKNNVFKEIISNTELLIFEKIDSSYLEQEIKGTRIEQEIKKYFLIRKILLNGFKQEIEFDESEVLKKLSDLKKISLINSEIESAIKKLNSIKKTKKSKNIDLLLIIKEITKHNARLKENICDEYSNLLKIECFKDEIIFKNDKKITDDDWKKYGNDFIEKIITEFQSCPKKLQKETNFNGLKLEMNEIFFHAEIQNILKDKYLSDFKFDKQICVEEIIKAFNHSGFLIDSCLFNIMESISKELITNE